jgi:hypothetical protein
MASRAAVCSGEIRPSGGVWGIKVSVYVDSFNARFGRMIMCHMIADTTEELIAMADKIGVQRKWIQHRGERHEHFDICQSKRMLAVKAGALEVDTYEMVKVIQRRAGAAAYRGNDDQD